MTGTQLSAINIRLCYEEDDSLLTRKAMRTEAIELGVRADSGFKSPTWGSGNHLRTEQRK